MSIRDVSTARPPTPGIQTKAAAIQQKVTTAYMHPNNVDDIKMQRFPKYIHDSYMSALSKIIHGEPITEDERNRVTSIEEHTDGAIRVLDTSNPKPI